jgi:hypothetical protein
MMWVMVMRWLLQLYRFVALYLVLILTWTYDVIVYMLVGVRVRNLIKQSSYLKKEDIDRTKKMIRQVAIYPIIMVILWGFAVANRVHDTLHPNNPSFLLFLLEAIFSPLNGFADAIACMSKAGPILSMCYISIFS